MANKRIEKQCLVCGNKFLSRREGKVCSRKCSELFYSNLHRGLYGNLYKFEVFCFVCKTLMLVAEREKLFPLQEKYFCSRSCSNTRKHSRETRIKTRITLKKRCGTYEPGDGNLFILKEDKKKRVKKEINSSPKQFNYNLFKICKSCGEMFKKRDTIDRINFCPSCRPYAQLQKFFSKLNISEKKLNIANETATSILLNLYHTEKKSMPEIRDVFGLNLNSLRLFFNNNKIQSRTLSESSTNSLQQGKHNKNYKYKNFNFRSSYELRIAKVLDERNIYFEYETLSIPYCFENRISHYVPDFYIPSENLIIEAKAELWFFIDEKKTLSKIEGAIQKYKYIMFFEKQIEEFENGKSLDILIKENLLN